MRFWLQLPQGGWIASREHIHLYAELGEELGFDGAWLADHIVIPIGYEAKYPYGELHPVPPDRPFLEAYTTLAYVAGRTERLRLAVAVAIGPYRHPVFHAKVVATLDYLSNGRLELGVGTGWLREEFDVLGADYKSRQNVTDEYLESMRLLWTGEPTRVPGRIVDSHMVQCLPQPVQRPHPPIWVGGSSEAAFKRMEHFSAGWLAPDLDIDRFFQLLVRRRDYFETLGNRSLPRVSAKLWVATETVDDPQSLTLSVAAGRGAALLERLHGSGVTDIRLDFSRIAVDERIGAVYKLARVLRKAGYRNQ